ncbi:MAG: 3'-5' exonuclease, partial [Candidatus Helarchaeota archaeon]
MTLDKFMKKEYERSEKQEVVSKNISREGEMGGKLKPAKEEKARSVKEPKDELAAVEDKSIEGVILDVGYDGALAKAVLWIYDLETENLIKWYDPSGHKPYLLSDLGKSEIETRYSKVLKHRGFVKLKEIRKFDLLRDRAIKMTKVIARDPLSIGGRGDSIRNLLPNHSWEDYIRYHKCYAYDKQIVLGMPYQLDGGKISSIQAEIPGKVKLEIQELFKGEKEDYLLALDQFLGYFFSPIPDIKRVAFDIEVFSKPNRIPDAEKADEQIICITFAGNDGFRQILTLRREEIEEGETIPECGSDPIFFTNEKEILQETFRIFENYPVVLSFNGDNFDIKYIYNRAIKHLGFRRDQIPIYMTRSPQSEVGHIKNGIHLDLYKFFHNRAIRVSAFRNLYKDVSLDTVGQTFLHDTKISLEKPISELDLQQLGYYCLQDSKLTLNLTTFNNNLIMNLIILLMRITRLSMEDLPRQGVSTWLRNLFYAIHRARAFLIPNPEYLQRIKGKASTKAMIKGKKFKGAIVVKPHPGIHFNVVVLDFASLYPSI